MERKEWTLTAVSEIAKADGSSENNLPAVRLQALRCLNWSKTPRQPCEIRLLSSYALSMPDSVPVQKRGRWSSRPYSELGETESARRGGRQTNSRTL